MWIVLVVYHNSVRSVLYMCSYSVTSVACVLLHPITNTPSVCVSLYVCICVCMCVRCSVCRVLHHMEDKCLTSTKNHMYFIIVKHLIL